MSRGDTRYILYRDGGASLYIYIYIYLGASRVYIFGRVTIYKRTGSTVFAKDTFERRADSPRDGDGVWLLDQVIRYELIHPSDHSDALAQHKTIIPCAAYVLKYTVPPGVQVSRVFSLLGLYSF